MRWGKFLFPIMLLTLCVVFSHACAERNEPESKAFNLPASLRIIDEGAFENTGASVVYFHDSVEHIGSRSFANMPHLKAVCIPKTTSFIGERAFDNHDRLIVIGIWGSYAHRWAVKNGYVFVHMDLWKDEHETHALRLSDLQQRIVFDQRRPDRSRIRANGQEYSTADPKSRMEYYPIEYDFP